MGQAGEHSYRGSGEGGPLNSRSPTRPAKKRLKNVEAVPEEEEDSVGRTGRGGGSEGGGGGFAAGTSSRPSLSRTTKRQTRFFDNDQDSVAGLDDEEEYEPSDDDGDRDEEEYDPSDDDECGHSDGSGGKTTARSGSQNGSSSRQAPSRPVGKNSSGASSGGGGRAYTAEEEEMEDEEEGDQTEAGVPDKKRQCNKKKSKGKDGDSQATSRPKKKNLEGRDRGRAVARKKQVILK